MENDGHALNVDLFYEPSDYIVMYGSKRKQHKYIPDFYSVKENCVYEVKPSTRLNGRRVVQKAQAAQTKLMGLGVDFKFMTEKDFVYFSRRVASQDPDLIIE
jgi:hypothetical protein